MTSSKEKLAVISENKGGKKQVALGEKFGFSKKAVNTAFQVLSKRSTWKTQESLKQHETLVATYCKHVLSSRSTEGILYKTLCQEVIELR